ncbi:hypothetical protein GA0074695_2361 [Micromonospora viridifaciens]|uniref:Uncharacterized protein n=1 Tax=Micromonospora viridifaciens TaxID=1881 RepID=A0A1C4WFI8_MICVI|nr:hypothetical protein GA0074695_2361 [Micromonospora viridifaciens]
MVIPDLPCLSNPQRGSELRRPYPAHRAGKPSAPRRWTRSIPGANAFVKEAGRGLSSRPVTTCQCGDHRWYGAAPPDRGAPARTYVRLACERGVANALVHHDPLGPGRELAQRVSVVERVVDSTAELRRLVDRARADPHVVAFPHRRVRELVGDEPDCYGAGHRYVGGSATRPGRVLEQMDAPRPNGAGRIYGVSGPVAGSGVVPSAGPGQPPASGGPAARQPPRPAAIGPRAGVPGRRSQQRPPPRRSSSARGSPMAPGRPRQPVAAPACVVKAC